MLVQAKAGSNTGHGAIMGKELPGQAQWSLEDGGNTRVALGVLLIRTVSLRWIAPRSKLTRRFDSACRWRHGTCCSSMQ